MGCASSLAVARQSPNGLKSTLLTELEKRLIKRTWRHMSNNMTGYGTKVFLRIFELHPNVKKLFPCRNVDGADLVKDPNFKGHASRFMQAVGAAVDNIDDIESALTPLLVGLGKQHIKFTGFKPEYFDAFTEAMIHTWQQELQGDFTADTRHAWTTVFSFIMQSLKDGHSAALAECE